MSAGPAATTLKPDRDLAKLAPAFRFCVDAAIAECNAGPGGGLHAMVYEGFRSQALQALYYQRGRTIIPPTKTVTNAPTNLYSWHGFGLAVDVIHAEKLWDMPDAWFAEVAVIFKKHGCTWGGDWTMVDLPHFQFGRCTASPTDGTRTLLAQQGLEGVWKALMAD